MGADDSRRRLRGCFGWACDVSGRSVYRRVRISGPKEEPRLGGFRCDKLQLLIMVEVTYSNCSQFG